MENKIERVDGEKVFCYTYDSLVRELSKKMVVREEVLAPEDGEVTIGDHESIFNWIKAIDFEEGKTPAIEATFSSDGGKKTVRLDTEKLTPVGSLEEKASTEDLLYSMALTEAKMKVVSAIAEEVYPAVAFQISDYRKDMGKMRDEILENKSRVSSFDEVMHGALSRKNMASVIVVGSLLMSSCVPIVDAGVLKPIEPTNNPAMTETFIPPTETGTENPTAAAVTVIPSETATETAPSDFIKINLDNVIYPPMGDVKENFEKGEYDTSVETLKRWVNIWGEMGVFDGLGDIYDNGLVLIPLVGGEKVSCVALKSDKYAKTLYCPPIDNVVGGLKTISDSNQKQETDKPIIVSLTGTEGLTIRGKGSELTYQIADKYTNKGIRYYDINTKGFVEGSFIAPLEVKENEPIEGSVVCVADEFCMGGQMKIDQEMAVRYYDRFMNALVNNEENREYFDQLLHGNISLESLKSYLIESDGIIPPGLKLMGDSGGGYFRMLHVMDREIKINALKTIAFGPTEWKNNVGNIQEYINSVDRVGLADPFGGDLGVSLVFLGWFVDRSGYMVLVSGSKDYESNYNDGRIEDPFPVIGGKDGGYLPERDNMIATATFLSWANILENSEKSRPFFVVPLMDIPGQPMVLNKDVVNFSGNRTLFVK